MSGWTPADLLPAAWLVLLAVLLGHGLGRWGVPVPALAWAAFAGVLLALLAPSLLLGRVFAPVQSLVAFPPFGELAGSRGGGNPLHGDLLLQTIPWQAAVRRFLAAGEWPLWNPWTGAGAPLLANPQAQALQPLVWLALPLSLGRALGVEAALRVLVALVFTFVLLRHQGAGKPAALFGAAAYGGSGFLILYLGWPLASSAALLPLAVYATLRWLDGRDRASWAILVIALATVLAAGHPDTVLWVLLAAGGFALPRLPRGGAGWLAAVLTAGALTAPALAPASFQVSRSHRAAVTAGYAERVEAHFAGTGGWAGAASRGSLAAAGRRLLPVAAPNAFGNDRFGRFWGDEGNVNAAAGGFAGSAALLGALLALPALLTRRPPALAGERVAAVLVLLSVVLVARLPGVTLLFAQVPGLDRSPPFPRRAHMVLAFGVAYLGAAAVERWRRGALPPRRVLAGTVALAGVVSWGYLAHPFPEDPSALASLRLSSLALHLGVLAGAAGLLASRRLGRARWAAFVLVGLQAAELVVLHGPANPAAPAELFYPRAPALDFLAERAGGERVAGLGRALPPNVATVYGLADVRSDDPFKPWAVQRLLDPALPRARARRFAIGDTLAEATHPVLDLLGVRWVLAAAGRRPPPLERVYAGAGAAVYARPRPLERLFLPASASVAGAADGPAARPIPAWSRWTAANPDFAARSLVAPSPGRTGPWRSARPAEAVLEPRPRGSTRWSARAFLPEARLLATGIYQDGGWRVLVDGRPVPAVITNGTLVGVWLPAGELRVELLYRPPGFVAGCLAGALALALLVAVAVPPPAVGLRRPASYREARNLLD
ncbi:MAG TPA: YfhO family protein [Thermoanaerobaculia bacterium]|nr:YfhO family protein [Thermoanaerobaculia bacterium]